MNQQDKAAPAASIENFELGEVLRMWAGIDAFDPQTPEYRAVIDYIDAHAAQRYEAGYRKGCAATLIGPVVQGWQERADRSDASLARAEAAEAELEEWRFTNRIDELQRRCDRAEASLARLVEGINTLPVVYERTITGKDGLDVQAAVWRADVLALLPAKAETPTSGPTPDIAATGPDIATPAPAMGEELPPPVEPWENGLPLCPSAEEISRAMEAEITAWRACMALRQPAYDDFAAKRLRLVAEKLGLGAAIPADNFTLWGCAFAVLGQIRRAIDGLTATAPVSQPAAQETAQQNGGLMRAALIDLMEVERVALHGEYTQDGTYNFTQQNHYRALFARARAALSATANTAPQPITAPAGSEQEIGLQQLADIVHESGVFNEFGMRAFLNGDELEYVPDDLLRIVRAALAAQQKNGGASSQGGKP